MLNLSRCTSDGTKNAFRAFFRAGAGKLALSVDLAASLYERRHNKLLSEQFL